MTTTDTMTPGDTCPADDPGGTGNHNQCPHPPGATVWLGGQAWAHPEAIPTHGLTPITTAHPYPGNPRRGDQNTITASLRDLGLYTGIVTQATTGHTLVGNHRLRSLTELGAQLAPLVPLAVDDDRAAAVVIRDNFTSDQATNDEADLLALLTRSEDTLHLSGMTGDDVEALARLLDEDDLSRYTRKANPVHYEPTMDEPPPVADLVDASKTNSLVADIMAADLPEDLRTFLVGAAQRHLVFRYDRIAEFYAHASPDIQALMEASALVIIDFDDAVYHGYVALSETLEAIREADLDKRAGTPDTDPESGAATDEG